MCNRHRFTGHHPSMFSRPGSAPIVVGNGAAGMVTIDMTVLSQNDVRESAAGVISMISMIATIVGIKIRTTLMCGLLN